MGHHFIAAACWLFRNSDLLENELQRRNTSLDLCCVDRLHRRGRGIYLFHAAMDLSGLGFLLGVIREFAVLSYCFLVAARVTHPTEGMT